MASKNIGKEPASHCWGEHYFDDWTDYLWNRDVDTEKVYVHKTSVSNLWENESGEKYQLNKLFHNYVTWSTRQRCFVHWGTAENVFIKLQSSDSLLFCGAISSPKCSATLLFYCFKLTKSAALIICSMYQNTRQIFQSYSCAFSEDNFLLLEKKIISAFEIKTD